jgi:hypothetical protein
MHGVGAEGVDLCHGAGLQPEPECIANSLREGVKLG